ncbi:MAG: hypothetical protein AB7U20_24610 [Planctomycetaceae bacterium]
MSALITGVFGLLGTVATIFAVRQDGPQLPSTPPAINPIQTASGQPLSTPQPAALGLDSMVATRPTPPNLLLHFAAFQSRLADSTLSDAERTRIVRALQGHMVVWNGYVDAVTPMASPTPDAAITVSLVESQVKVGQSMFKTPAHFRFGPDALDAVSRLVPGDQVTISGTLTDHSLIATNVTGARLMTVNGLPAGRAIAAPETESPR